MLLLVWMVYFPDIITGSAVYFLSADRCYYWFRCLVDASGGSSGLSDVIIISVLDQRSPLVHIYLIFS